MVCCGVERCDLEVDVLEVRGAVRSQRRITVPRIHVMESELRERATS